MSGLLRRALGRATLPWRLGRWGRDAWVHPFARVFHPERVGLGDGARVGARAYLIGNTREPLGIYVAAGAQVGEEAYLAATDGWIVVGPRASVGPGAILYGNGGLWIGARARLGPDVAVSTVGHAHRRSDLPMRAQGLVLAPVRVEAEAVVGARAVLLPGVTVGRGAVVAEGSVVTRSVPPGAVVGGVPARPLVEAA